MNRAIHWLRLARAGRRHSAGRAARALPFALAGLAALGSGCQPTRNDDPVTDFSCRVVVPDLPANLQAGGPPLAISARVTNLGGQAWPGWRADYSRTRAVAVGVRWWPIQQNAGPLVPLFEDLKPGETVVVSLDITPPAEPGKYALRVEPMQEQVAWFGDRGDCIARLAVTVTR